MRFEGQALKKIIAVSDSHGNRRAFEELDGIFQESDYIIHLGDTSSDGGVIRAKYPDKTIVINGNCDPLKLGEDEAVLQAENVKIFLCHGHLYSVKATLLKLAREAKAQDCALALYGHTHTPKENEIGGVTLLNPGTLSRYGNKSYLYLVINGDKFTHKIVYL